MFPDMEDAEINSRLVGYCSDQVTILEGEREGGREGGREGMCGSYFCLP